MKQVLSGIISVLAREQRLLLGTDILQDRTRSWTCAGLIAKGGSRLLVLAGLFGAPTSIGSESKAWNIDEDEQLLREVACPSSPQS